MYPDRTFRQPGATPREIRRHVLPSPEGAKGPTVDVGRQRVPFAPLGLCRNGLSSGGLRPWPNPFAPLGLAGHGTGNGSFAGACAWEKGRGQVPKKCTARASPATQAAAPDAQCSRLNGQRKRQPRTRTRTRTSTTRQHACPPATTLRKHPAPNGAKGFSRGRKPPDSNRLAREPRRGERSDR